MSVQLPLELGLPPPAHSFANYVAGANETAYQVLLQVMRREGDNSVYLWGGSGTGKTHLLQAACREVSAQDNAALYLPLAEHAKFSPEILEGLENLDLVCLDDIQYIVGDSEWETALFGLFNRLRDSRTPLLLCANAAPNALGLGLHDLESRFNWSGVFCLQPLDEAATLRVVQEYARILGLDLAHPVATYLVRHCSRNLKILMEWLDRIDYASLSAKRRVTIPFIRDLLTGTLNISR